MVFCESDWQQSGLNLRLGIEERKRNELIQGTGEAQRFFEQLKNATTGSTFFLTLSLLWRSSIAFFALFRATCPCHYFLFFSKCYRRKLEAIFSDVIMNLTSRSFTCTIFARLFLLFCFQHSFGLIAAVLGFFVTKYMRKCTSYEPFEQMFLVDLFLVDQNVFFFDFISRVVCAWLHDFCVENLNLLCEKVIVSEKFAKAF